MWDAIGEIIANGMIVYAVYRFGRWCRYWGPQPAWRLAAIVITILVATNFAEFARGFLQAWSGPR
jgi:hypothetical protein